MRWLSSPLYQLPLERPLHAVGRRTTGGIRSGGNIKRLTATLDQMGATGYTRAPPWVATTTKTVSVTTSQAPAIGGARSSKRSEHFRRTRTHANIVRVCSPELECEQGERTRTPPLKGVHLFACSSRRQALVRNRMTAEMRRYQFGRTSVRT